MLSETDREIRDLLHALLRRESIAAGFCSDPLTGRALRNTQCNGKDKFTSFEIAARVARAVAHRNGEQVSVYRCSCCGAFHVGGGVRRRERAA